MPYNTRRKSLSLPSLGIHIPVTHAARAAAASKNAVRPSSSSSTSASPPTVSSIRSESPESHPNKRRKRSHGEASVGEQTPPLSPTPAASIDMTDAAVMPKVDVEGINDDIVTAVILQLQSTGNRPHLIRDLATVLAQQLASVQQSANPCAIISSRLAAYMKRPSWSALARCPLAKELEPIHPRRTFFYLTTYPRQPLPDSNAMQTARASIITPSVSLTDDSGSDEDELRRRQMSPSPEVDLSPPEFDEVDEDLMPSTPIGSLPKQHYWDPRDHRRDSPPLEKDEREFTQTADVLQKRKLSNETTPETTDRSSGMEYGFRDDGWFSDSRQLPTMTFLASPAMKPSIAPMVRKEDEAESWLKLNLIEWDKGAESIEIDELDCLLDTY